jgi:outer membrane immunogenic protein
MKRQQAPFAARAQKIIVAAAALVILISGRAIAGDLSMGYGAPPPIPFYNWTGFYLGAHIGGGWNGTDWFEDATSSGSGGFATPGFEDGSVNASGFLAGGQAGFDFQTGWVVWGVQADGSWANITGSAGCFGEVVGTTQSCSQSVNGLGTITGRVGAAYNTFLFYFLAGAAWEHEQLQNTCVVCGPPPTLSVSDTTWGYTVGLGLEWAFARNWSAFLQYNYADFGTRDVSFAGVFTENIRENMNIFKVGVNYRFEWGPGPIRY